MEAGLDAIEAQPRVYEDLQQSDWRIASGDEREWQADVERLNRAYRRLKERLIASTNDLGQIRYLRALQEACRVAVCSG